MLLSFLIVPYLISTTTIHVIPHIYCPYPPPPSSSHISFVVSIVSPLYHISAATVSAALRLRLASPPRVSAAVSAVILVRRPCHLACLLPLYLSTLFYKYLFICRRLHHPASLPPPYLLSYISAVSLLLLSPSPRISAAAVPIVTRLCCPIPFGIDGNYPFYIITK